MTLEEWMNEIDDKGLISEEEMLSQMWDGKDHPPVTKNPIIETNKDLITISCETEGASIGFKIIDKNIEPKSWDVYTQPITLKKREKLLFQAHRIGYEPSPVLEYVK